MDSGLKAASPAPGRGLEGFIASRRWALGLAGVVMVLTTLPAFLGFAVQGEAYRFTGFVFGVEDVNSYLAKMLSGQAGAWLFRTPYTPLPQQGVLLFLPYILLGKLAAPPGLHEQLAALYHIFRWLAILLAVLATDDFLACFITSERWRRFGLGLAILGGGLGWILVLLGQDYWLGSLPLEFYSPESFGFLGLYGFPHLGVARAALLWALVVYLRVAWPTDAGLASQPAFRPAREMAGLAFLWLLAGLMQPLAALVIGVVLVMHLTWQAAATSAFSPAERPVAWRAWVRAAGLVVAAGVLPGLYVLYNAISVWTDPFLQAWTAQNVIRSPHILHYLAAYGLVLPFAWAGGRWVLRQQPVVGRLLVGWVLLFPLLAYLPVNLQRRLPEGVWVAWAALALLGLARQDERPPGESPAEKAGATRQAGRRWLAAPLALAFPSTVLLLIGGGLTASHPGPPVFRPVDEVALFEYLRQEANPGQVVLSAYETGNALPAWAPLRVVVGHGPESARLEEIRPQVNAFYASSTPDAERLRLIQQYQVDYVFWGPAERALGDWQPAQASFLQLAFQQGEYAVYRLVQ